MLVVYVLDEEFEIKVVAATAGIWGASSVIGSDNIRCGSGGGGG